MCSGCGSPRTFSMDPDSHGHYVAKVVRCNGCTEQAEAGRKNEKAKPGSYLVVKPDEAVEHAMDSPFLNVAPETWRLLGEDPPTDDDE